MKYKSRYQVLSVKRAGQRGTKRLLEEYGDRLRNVRYMRDRLTGERFKTAEIVVEGRPWLKKGIDPDRTVGVKIGLHETELRAKVKQHGGSWDRFDRVWLVKYKHLELLGLANREFMIREEEGQYEIGPGSHG